MRRFVNVKKRFSVGDKQFLPDALSFIHATLEQLGLKRKLAQKVELLSEETLVMLAGQAPEGAELQVQVRRVLGDASVSFSVPGEKFDPYRGAGEAVLDMDALLSEDTIRSILLHSHGEKYKYQHKNGVNRVRILSGQSERNTTTATFIALGLGLLLGLLAKQVFPQLITEGLCTYLLDPIKTMFMNALKIIIAPVVFFSIVTCFSQFNSLAEFGKLGAKVVGIYLLTTLIAVTLGIGLAVLLKPGAWGFALAGGVEAAAVEVDTNVDSGILQMIVNIVPSNFLSPFLESNTLQIIFLAVLCGIALGMIGQYSATLKELFESFNSLFLTVTTLITKLIPLAVFASVALIVIELNEDSLFSVLGACGVYSLAVVGMLCVYGLVTLLIGRLNPLVFFRKAWEGMLTSFTLSSSSAAMPTNIRVCTDKLGISPRVANFSIPLGATINMDGACLYMTVLAVFLARAYGIEIPTAGLVTLGITSILLSLGAPGVPGAALICLGIVLESVGVPVEAIGLVMAVNPILDMVDTMSNTTGDMTAALIVANSEKLLDLERFQS